MDFNNILHLVSGTAMGLILGWFLNLVVLRSLQELPRQESVNKLTQDTISEPFHLRVFLLLCAFPLFVVLLTVWRSWTPELLSDLILVASLFAIAIIDWERLLIDNRFVLASLGLRLAWLMVFEPGFMLDALCGLLAGIGLLYLLGFIYETLRKRQGLGDGDPALLGLTGLWVGWTGLGPVLIIAALSGILVGGIWLWRTKQPIFHSPIPFGPFLCLGGWLVHLLQQFGWIPRQLGLVVL